MGKVLTHMTMSLDGFIAQPDDIAGRDLRLVRRRRRVGPERQPDVTFDGRCHQRRRAARPDRQRRRAHLRPPALRHHRRLGRQAPRRRAGRGGDPPRGPTTRSGGRGRASSTTCGRRRGAREIAGDKDVTIAEHEDRPAGARPRARRRGLREPRPGAPRRGHPVLRQARPWSRAVRRPGRGPGHACPSPAIPGSTLTARGNDHRHGILALESNPPLGHPRHRRPARVRGCLPRSPSGSASAAERDSKIAKALNAPQNWRQRRAAKAGLNRQTPQTCSAPPSRSRCWMSGTRRLRNAV